MSGNSMIRPVFNPNLDNYWGGINSPVELMEYGDYQCLHCGDAFLTIKMLQKALGWRLRYVFRNFPLSDMHPLAAESAVAAEAARRQGKFWEMHDLLFKNQLYLNRASFGWLAQDGGLDMGRFVSDCQCSGVHQKISADLKSGIISGVEGTPAFFINGVRYEGYTDVMELYDACYSIIACRDRK